MDTSATVTAPASKGPGSSPPRTALLLLLVIAVWCGVVFISPQISLSDSAWHLVKFFHLASLALGFGAVLVVDFCALAALVGRHSPAFATRMAATIDPVIWAGYAGLVLSGLFLHPDLNSTPMWIKLVAVLVAGGNGVLARNGMRAMLALPAETKVADIPRRLLVRVSAQAAVSQAVWWTAAIIGYFWI